jgi:hypothetical protein
MMLLLRRNVDDDEEDEEDKYKDKEIEKYLTGKEDRSP